MIARLRAHNHGSIYAEPVSAPVARQIITSMRIIMGDLAGSDGQDRLTRLAHNARYFAAGLRRLGFIVYGEPGSPVIPLLLFNPAKIPYAFPP